VTLPNNFIPKRHVDAIGVPASIFNNLKVGCS